MKKALILALSAAMALGSVTPAFAANGNGYENGNDNGYEYQNGNDNDYEYEYLGNENGANDNDANDNDAYGNDIELEYDFLVGEAPAAPAPVGRTGYITDYYNGRLTVSFGETDGFEDAIVLNLQPGTVIIDAETGMPATIADRENDRVKIYHSPVTTRSLPPQSNAIAVAINLGENAFAPIHHTIEAIELYDEDTARITVDNGGLIITLERETPLFPHLTRQMVHIDTLEVGDTLLFWYEAVGMSFPAVTTASRALWLGAAPVANGYDNDNDYEANDNDYANDYGYGNDNDQNDNDYVAEPAAPFAVPGTGVLINGVEFFPVRQTVYPLGIVPTWDQETSSAILVVNGYTISLANNATSFYVNGTAYELPAAVVIADGVMYAPAAFFNIFR